MSYTTKKSLLEAIQKGDDISWNEFYEMYRPLMVLRGKDYCLTPDELDELCQLVMIDVFNMQKTFRYDPEKGRFRDYLRKIISHNAVDLIRKRGDSSPVVPEDAELTNDEMASRWIEEWRNYTVQQAMNVLRSRLDPATWQAFELYSVQGQDARTVAKLLDIRINMVYVAKCRAMTMLRKILREMGENE